jgi:hypothetical protein
MDTSHLKSVDMMNEKAWNRWFRATDVEDLMSGFAGMIADYIDGPRAGDAARFDELLALVARYDREAEGAPLLVELIAKTMDAVASVYRKVSRGEITLLAHRAQEKRRIARY